MLFRAAGSHENSCRLDRRMRRAWMAGCACALAGLLAGSLIAAIPVDAAFAARHAQAKAKQSHRSGKVARSRSKQLRANRSKKHKTVHARKSRSAAKRSASADKPATPALPGELGVVQRAIGLARKGELSEAATLAKSLSDPAAQKLVEWISLRTGDSEARFDRYVAFIRANPDWPGMSSLRRRAEARLWHDRRNGPTVREFLGGRPATAMGRLALARVLTSEGDGPAAEREIRAAWRSEELSAELEAAVREEFGDVLTRADHTARMGRRIGKKDFGAAMRAANRLGEGAVAIVKACSATFGKSDKARKLLDAVPNEARDDLGYMLCRIHHLARSDVAAATKLMLVVEPDSLQAQDTDQWWRERRMLARELLDLGDPNSAYEVVRSAAAPENPYYLAESHFMAGWIALRFLDDPATALSHFGQVGDGSINPIVLSRAAYWRGRAYEAAGQTAAMRANYEAAARYSTAYYGQLARERLGLGNIELRPSPEPVQNESADILRAAELLYTIGERQLALSFLTGFAEQSDDAAALAALAGLAARNNDARAVLLVGKTALARGLPLDVHAFPDIGVPAYDPIGPALDRSIVFSVARTESEFNQRDVSPAKAVGLMQVTPEAGRDTAKRFGVRYDWKRLVNDPVYNTQMGAGEIAALLSEYRGSYIMSFAGYNAGRGRVQQWVARYGDPRDASVDAVDWVERIPFSETRNYVQRVMENLQVYRVRFGERAALAPKPGLGTKHVDDKARKPGLQAREAAAR